MSTTDPKQWEAEIASFDRAVRRSNLRWKRHTIRLDHAQVAMITSRRTLPLDILNSLPAVNTFEEKQDAVNAKDEIAGPFPEKACGD